MTPISTGTPCFLDKNGFLDKRCLTRLLTFVKAAMFFAALGQEKKLLALAKADRSFVGHRPLSGHEGDINSSNGRGASDFAEFIFVAWMPGVFGGSSTTFFLQKTTPCGVLLAMLMIYIYIYIFWCRGFGAWRMASKGLTLTLNPSPSLSCCGRREREQGQRLWRKSCTMRDVRRSFDRLAPSRSCSRLYGVCSVQRRQAFMS